MSEERHRLFESKGKKARQLLTIGSIGVPIGLVLAIAIHFASGGYFFRMGNVFNLLHHMASVGLITFGLTFVVATREFDISVAHASSLTGVLVAILLIRTGFGTTAALLATLGAMLLGGFLNGFLVGYRRYMSIAVTIASANLMFGLNYILSGARPIYGRMPEAFVFLGNGHLGPIPFPAIILVLAYVLGYFVLHRSRYGHYLFAIGDNMESAYAAGINVRWLKMTTFLISSGCAAMAGFLHTAWIGSGQPQVGPSYLMEAMAAVFFGCAIGRRGNTSLWGSLQGITVMAILAKGVNILGQPFWLQQIAAGILLLGSLFAMHWSKRRREARKALEQV